VGGPRLAVADRGGIAGVDALDADQVADNLDRLPLQAVVIDRCGHIYAGCCGVACTSPTRCSPVRQHGVKAFPARVKEASAPGPADLPRPRLGPVDSDVTGEGPSMADLAYALLLVGGFALLALMVRGLDAL
jgi:hypothetical protein